MALVERWNELMLLYRAGSVLELITVYDSTVDIRSLLRTRTRDAFTAYFQETGDAKVAQPSMLYQDVKTYFNMLSRLDPHSFGVGLDQVVQQIFMGECYLSAASEIGKIVSPTPPPNDSTDKRFISIFCTRFIDTLERLPPQSLSNHMLISNFADGFIQHRSENQYSLRYDAHEFYSIGTVLGPHGCRVLDSHILSIIHRHAASIKDIMVRHRILIEKAR